MPTQEELSRPTFNYTSAARATQHGVHIRYVGLTGAAVDFVKTKLVEFRSIHRPPRTPESSVALIESLAGEPVMGWHYGSTQRYQEQVQRMPWDKDIVYIYTFLRDMETGKKMFLWELDTNEKKVKFNYGTGKFAQ